MNPQRVRLFIKPYCPWCQRALQWLQDRGIAHETVDVIASEAAFEEMRRLSGQDRAPTLEVDGRVLADFGPEELAKFWESLKREA